MAANGNRILSGKRNYASFKSAGDCHVRIGLLDFDNNLITSLAYRSGAQVSSLYEVIEAGENSFVTTDDVFHLSNVKLLAPISGRDVLAVGKNYAEHAKEFNNSGLVLGGRELLDHGN